MRVFTRFIGTIIVLVLIAAFLPTIMQVLGVVFAWIAGGVVALIVLIIALRLLLRRRPANIHIYHYR